MVDKAMAYWKANGKDKAIAEFNNPNGQFVKGDLYVFANELSGVILANGGNPKLVGQNRLELKDPSGKVFNKEMIEMVKTKGSGWVDYVWTNPVTKKVQPKSARVQRVEGPDVYIGSGVWKWRNRSMAGPGFSLVRLSTLCCIRECHYENMAQ